MNPTGLSLARLSQTAWCHTCSSLESITSLAHIDSDTYPNAVIRRATLACGHKTSIVRRKG